MGNHAAVRQALARVQTAARLLLETLAAEFNDCLFPQAWEIFDLRSWEGASVAGRQRLMDKFSTICRHRCWNQARTEREFAIVRDTALNKFMSFLSTLETTTARPLSLATSPRRARRRSRSASPRAARRRARGA